MELRDILGLLIPAMWVGWAIYWIVASRDVKAIGWHESVSSRLQHIVPLVLAGVLLSAPALMPAVLDERISDRSLPSFIVAVLLVAAGIGFAIWARRHIGRNWSGTVQVKQDHALVTTGPYRLVRHPIYTGLLLAVAGSAVAVAEWRGVIALLLVFVSFWRKLKVEEARMRETFPEYAAYQRRTSALVPYLL